MDFFIGSISFYNESNLYVSKSVKISESIIDAA